MKRPSGDTGQGIASSSSIERGEVLIQINSTRHTESIADPRLPAMGSLVQNGLRAVIENSRDPSARCGTSEWSRTESTGSATWISIMPSISAEMSRSSGSPALSSILAPITRSTSRMCCIRERAAIPLVANEESASLQRFWMKRTPTFRQLCHARVKNLRSSEATCSGLPSLSAPRWSRPSSSMR